MQNLSALATSLVHISQLKSCQFNAVYWRATNLILTAFLSKIYWPSKTSNFRRQTTRYVKRVQLISPIWLQVATLKTVASDCVYGDNWYVETIPNSPCLTVMVWSKITWFEDILHFFLTWRRNKRNDGCNQLVNRRSWWAALARICKNRVTE